MKNISKRSIFTLLKEEYIDSVYKLKEVEILEFMDRNFKQFKVFSEMNNFYFCSRSQEEFFIADCKETLDWIIQDDIENSDEPQVVVLREF